MKYEIVDAGGLCLQKVNFIVGFSLVGEIAPQCICD